MLVLFFYIVLSICNLFYTTLQALSFKSYRLYIKDMYVCMYVCIQLSMLSDTVSLKFRLDSK